ncbi:MAG: ABC transporter permease [Deltaproteobacteria bacterium]|nr:ABC transporter permease [Deltaproteobacteria bacterium]
MSEAVAKARLLWMFVRADFKSRYAGSSVGFFWSVIHPLIMLVVYTVVFSEFLDLKFNPGGSTGDFALNLFCGMLPWTALAGSIQRGVVCFQDNAVLLTKSRFPAIMLPLHIVVSEMLSLLIGLVLLVVFAMFFKSLPSWHLLLMPIVILFHFAFVLGLSWMAATVQVYFRDLRHFLDSFMLVWLFLTPVFYPPGMYPKRYQILLHANPMAHLVGIYREIVLNHRLPQVQGMAIFFSMSMLIFFLGYLVFRRARPKLADRL